MKTKAESKSILDDWVISKTDSTENPNFGFVETFYQTCSAALVSLRKSQFGTTKPGFHKGKLKNDIARMCLWKENFPSGHLDTILAESSSLKTAVLENLTGIGKIIVPYFTDHNNAISNASIKSVPERKFASELEMQLEKAALMVDPDETSDPSSDDETSDDSSSTTERHQNRLGRLHSYISCLIDLTPVVERYICILERKAEVQSVPIETVFRLSHRAQPYAILIRDRFTNAPTSLVERLAEANLERSIRLRTQDYDEEEVEDESHRDTVTLFKPFSIFHDSGLGSSVPARSQYAATVASHTSFLSVGGEEALGRPRVPSLPQEGNRPFQCDYCHRTISIRNRIEWKMHVFADLQSYICTHESCSAALKTFPTRKLWADHEFNEHFTLIQWRCFTCSITYSAPELFTQHLVQVHDIDVASNRLTAAISEARENTLATDFKDYKCLLCSQTGWQTKKAYATHVGQHLEEISLACLPRDEDDSSEYRSDTDISSAPNNVDEPTFSNREGSQIGDKSEGEYRPSSKPEAVPAQWAGEDIESYPDLIKDMTSPDKTSPQDRRRTLLPSLSLSNEQSAGSKSVRPSSYWTLAERHNFKTLVALLGEDYAAIAEIMKTKTPIMVRNYFSRQIAAGEVDLLDAAKAAEARKARGESPHLLAISNAAAQVDEPMKLPLIEQHKSHKLERERPKNLQQQGQMPNPDYSNQSQTKSGTQRPVLQELGRNDVQIQDRWEQIGTKELLEQHNHQPVALNPSDQSNGPYEQEHLMAGTKPSTRQEYDSKKIRDFPLDLGPFSSQVDSSSSNYTLGTQPDTLSTQATDGIVYGSPFREQPPQGDIGSSLEPNIPLLPSYILTDPLPGNFLEGLMGENPVPAEFRSFLDIPDHLHERSKSEEYVPARWDSETQDPKAGARPVSDGKHTKCHYRCRQPGCHVRIKSKAVFKRHVSTMHYHERVFSCGFEGCEVYYRRDKLIHHLHLHHTGKLGGKDIDKLKIELLAPVICPLCQKTVQNWQEFYACFISHCEVREAGEESRVTI